MITPINRYPKLAAKALKRFAITAKQSAHTISQITFPHFCPLCQNVSESYYCQDCLGSFKLIEHACSQCHVPLSHKQAHQVLCADCLKQKPLFHQTICAFEYSYPFSESIKKFKEQGDYHAAHQACSILAQKVVQHYSDKDGRFIAIPELLVPVPIHWKKRWQRGFNQSEYIAKRLSRDLGIPNAVALTKTKTTNHQKTLSRKERQKNLRGSFRASTPKINGKYIALIDDVITTGSTANVLADLCLKSGAQQIDIWALARTPKS